MMLRAVEKFEQALPMAARLTKMGGWIALMIGSGQIDSATRVAKDVNWSIGVSIPCSSSRTLLVGTRPLKVE